jgi:hypothetical protein
MGQLLHMLKGTNVLSLTVSILAPLISSILQYFDYERVANTIDSQ